MIMVTMIAYDVIAGRNFSKSVFHIMQSLSVAGGTAKSLIRAIFTLVMLFHFIIFDSSPKHSL